MNTPQAVTVRYASGLLKRGWNSEYEILTLSRDVAIQDEICVGTYYNVTITNCVTHEKFSAAGTTPLQAVERALEKFGVTFR